MKERIEILEKKVQVIQEVLEETLKMLDSINFVRQPMPITTKESLRSEALNVLRKTYENDKLVTKVHECMRKAASCGEFSVEIDLESGGNYDGIMDYLNNVLDLEAYIMASREREIMVIEWD